MKKYDRNFIQRNVALCAILIASLACQLIAPATEEPPAPQTDAPAATAPVATPTQVAPGETPLPPLSEAPTPTAPATPASEAAGALIDDFEGDDFDQRWWSYTEEGTIAFECALHEPGHDSKHAMRLEFEIGEDAYPGCGVDVMPEELQRADGLSFFWRASRPGLIVIFVLDMKDPTQSVANGFTPFQAVLETPSDTWTEVKLTWDDFPKAEWVGDSGVDELDLAAVNDLYIGVDQGQAGSIWIDDLRLFTDEGGAAAPPAREPLAGDKWALWANGTQLRGANIYQRIVVPWLDGNEFLGDDYIGPPYTQDDFDRLAELGANYVNISGPGLFTAEPPYALDEKAQAYMDNLLDRIARADMFAVLTVRHGPGRSTFTITGWADESLMIDAVWEQEEAQDAYVEMWRYMAERYRDNPIVIGYDLMCEPNSNRLFEIWEPGEFYAQYGGTSYDWNQLYPRITRAIRQVDPNTPILVAGNGWSGLRWLPYLEPTGDPRTVYMFHQYEPQDQYTHQEPPPANSYPGSFDLDWDGVPDDFDRAWLQDFLSVVGDFQDKHGVVVGVNEFGAVRWAPGAAAFMDDQMALFEELGLNYALWAWDPSWRMWSDSVNEFNFRFGPDPDNHAQTPNDLMDVILEYWRCNTIRPSNFAR
ncbi:MAG: cellulase family glycosylhydrolase [Anaerolineales bacterium]|nr:cellulase family glycosylhydrolase [Anaerolineales bacterium]